VRTPRRRLPERRAARVVATLAVLVMVSCGTPPQVESGSPSNAGEAVEAHTPLQQSMLFGGQYRFGDGVTISVSSPKSFRPSDGAYPQSPRAVAFDVTIRNDGDQPYRLSGLSVSATIAGVATKQVVDSTQGYSGIVDAGRDVPVGHDVRVAVAFAVPDQPAELQLALRPTATSSVVAVYSGPA
jgi:hypothetical protein